MLVSVVPGPQEEYFTEAGIHHFYSESYEVTESCDRMGYRLEGPEVESKNGTDIVSDGIVFGSIQIPSSGKPIILMADHQTTGGYAKNRNCHPGRIFPKVAQCKPGDRIRFRKVSVEEAQEISRKERKKECF